MNAKKESLTMFMQHAPLRVELGGNLSDTQFRRGLMDKFMQQLDASNAKAATLYNDAKKHCEINRPELVVSLGRKKSNVAVKQVTNPSRAPSVPFVVGSENKRADSRQLFSIVTIADGKVDTVHAHYNKHDANRVAVNDELVVKGFPDIGDAVSSLKNIRK